MQTVETDNTSEHRAIREMVEKWLAASKAGDNDTVLSLMTDDVVFMVPRMEPFGKEAFKATSESRKNVLVEGKSDIKEIKVLGDWAWMRSHLTVITRMADEDPIERSGYVLTILKKNDDGHWVIARDANLLM